MTEQTTTGEAGVMLHDPPPERGGGGGGGAITGVGCAGTSVSVCVNVAAAADGGDAAAARRKQRKAAAGHASALTAEDLDSVLAKRDGALMQRFEAELLGLDVSLRKQLYALVSVREQALKNDLVRLMAEKRQFMHEELRRAISDRAVSYERQRSALAAAGQQPRAQQQQQQQQHQQQQHAQQGAPRLPLPMSWICCATAAAAGGDQQQHVDQPRVPSTSGPSASAQSFVPATHALIARSGAAIPGTLQLAGSPPVGRRKSGLRALPLPPPPPRAPT
jgi:hypothetical protein